MRHFFTLAGTGALYVLTVSATGNSTSRAADAPIIQPRTGSSETVQLFNGKDLKGWEGHSKYWSVQDGAIVGRNAEPLNVNTYLITKRKFSEFRLVATVKLVRSETHSGIAFWGRAVPERGDLYTYAGHLMIFPSPWGLYDLYGRGGLTSNADPAKRVGKQHGWNQLEILARGNRIRLVVNGTEIIDWHDPEHERIQEGPIGLQLHSNRESQEVQFKNLILTTFPDDKLVTLQQ